MNARAFAVPPRRLTIPACDISNRRRLLGAPKHNLFERGSHVVHGAIALIRVLGKALAHNRFHRGFVERRRIVAQDGTHDLSGRRAAERRLSRDNLVEEGAKTEDVRASVERLAVHLLRRHVGDGSHDDPGMGHADVGLR